MSRKNRTGHDLKLNLPPPPNANHSRTISTHDSSSSPTRVVSPTSPPNSCVSSEVDNRNSPSSPKEEASSSSMMLVGCPKCLMYVMLSAEDQRCPKCKSTVLLDFATNDNDSNNVNGKRKKKQTKF